MNETNNTNITPFNGTGALKSDAVAYVMPDAKALAGLALKLTKVQGEISRVPKNGKNKHFGYAYATEGDIKDTVRTLLAKHGIAFLTNMISVTNEGKRTTVTLQFTFIDSETGATISSIWSNHADDQQDKGIAKACTLALKYFLVNYFMISTGDEEMDPDAGLERKPTKKSVEPQQAGPWSTSESMADFHAAIQKRIPEVSQSEIASAVGIKKYTDYAAWNKQFDSGREAATAVIDALNKQLGVAEDDAPAQPTLIEDGAPDNNAAQYDESFS